MKIVDARTQMRLDDVPAGVPFWIDGAIALRADLPDRYSLVRDTDGHPDYTIPFPTDERRVVVLLASGKARVRHCNDTVTPDPEIRLQIGTPVLPEQDQGAS